MPAPLEVFVSYSRVDKTEQASLVTHLDVLQENGSIKLWADTAIEAGAEWDREIKQRLESADIFLCLVSKDFLASRYCKSIELKRALERHEGGSAKVIPIILRDCRWQASVLAKLLAVPDGGKPVIGGGWKNADKAFAVVVKEVQRVVDQIQSRRAAGGARMLDGPSTIVRDATPTDPLAVDVTSKYARYRVSEIVKQYLREADFNIDNLNLDAGMHARDLEVFCRRIYFPNKHMKEIRGVIQKARAEAFTVKYLKAEEDEKLVKLSSLGISGVRPWTAYLKPVLKKIGFGNLGDKDIVDVGAGNGEACKYLYDKVKSIDVVDISEPAITKFKSNLPNVKVRGHATAAEYLDTVPNASKDLYLSFRTYQSSLFDRRAALREAVRVLRYRGAVVLSVPVMFLRPGRTRPLSGLIPPGSTKPTLAYAKRMVDELFHLLRALSFHDVGVETSSPFEHFVYAKRSD
jgi:SAM-dependent methyltransferase